MRSKKSPPLSFTSRRWTILRLALQLYSPTDYRDRADKHGAPNFGRAICSGGVMAKVIEMAGFKQRKLKRAKANRRELRALCLDDFKRSGIDLETIEKLGITFCNADAMWAALNPKKAEQKPKAFTAEGWVLPFLDPDLKPLNYCRARGLRGLRGLRGQWSEDVSVKDRRYNQPANSLPHIYVPWQLIDYELADKVMLGGIDTVGVTEGEKKAIKAALCGLCYVGLGGASNYGAKRHGITLSADFKWFDWPALNAEICFDSDAYSNASVNQDMRQLAYRMRTDLKPKTLATVRLTSETGGKTALDDFLTAQGLAAFFALKREADAIGEAFAHFNSQLVWARKKPRYYNTATETFYLNQSAVVADLTGPKLATPLGKLVLPISLWLTEREPELTNVTDVVFVPGSDERFKTLATDEFATLNTWRPTDLKCLPVRRVAHIGPYLECVEYLTPFLTTDERSTLFDITAYPLQPKRLGCKVDVSVILVSEASGTGKNTYVRILRPMYGAHNVAEIEGSMLGSQFNDWTLKQLLLVNEVRVPTYSERVSVMSRLKTLITEDLVSLNRKYMPHENVPNHMNIWLTSNYPYDALRLDDDDRRFFVIRAPDVAAKWPKDKFAALNDWLDAGGTRAVYSWLMARDLRKFSPHLDAPRTVARLEMIRGGYDMLDDFIEILFTTPEKIIGKATVMGIKSPELFEPSELVQHMVDYAMRRKMALPNLTEHKLGAAMRRREFTKKVFGVRTNDERSQITYFALRNVKRWAERDKGKWREYWYAQQKRPK
jgi:hypothetical protein